MTDDDELEVGLTNFHDGDKSLWTKTIGTCFLCGGFIWILTTRYKAIGRLVTDMDAACGGCGISGNCDSLLGFDPEFMFRPPAESSP